MASDRIRMALGLALALALTVGGPGVMPASAQTAPDPAGGVTVVVEVRLEPNTAPAAALAALNDMRAMMKRQPGFLSESLLQNLNPANSPRYVHVSRWASMVQWSALFRAPEFNRLNAHGNEHYTISASAFVPAD